MSSRLTHMTRSEYRNWAERQPRGRFERVAGEVVAMSPERIAHARLKGRVFQLLDEAVRRANLPCEALPDGVTIEVDEDTDYEPDAVVNCGEKLHPDAIAAPNPVIVVEVLSPSPTGTDAGGGKLADYFRLPSVRHYLMVDTRRREIVHHRRAGDRIETRIVNAGPIALDPPGIAIAVEEVYRD